MKETYIHGKHKIEARQDQCGWQTWLLHRKGITLLITAMQFLGGGGTKRQLVGDVYHYQRLLSVKHSPQLVLSRTVYFKIRIPSEATSSKGYWGLLLSLFNYKHKFNNKLNNVWMWSSVCGGTEALFTTWKNDQRIKERPRYFHSARYR